MSKAQHKELVAEESLVFLANHNQFLSTESISTESKTEPTLPAFKN